MKKKQGSIFEYETLRNRDLIRAYDKQIALHFAERKPIILTEIFSLIADMPSTRFWVSEERAAIIVAGIMKGDTLEGMGKMKREMFMEIYKRTMDIRRANPKLSLYHAVAKACNQPAPKFYLTPNSVKVIIYKIKRGWYERRKKKWSI